METLIEIHGIPAERIEEVWPLANKYVARALKATPASICFDPEHIYLKLLNKDMQLWLITVGSDIVAAAVTQILIYPKCRTLDVSFMGGDLYDEWSTKFNTLMREYGIAHHCDYARGYGRLGWARKVKHLGITPSIYFDLPLQEVSRETLH